MDYKNINLPNHLAIIMDGNGRWAKEKGLKRSVGHLEGSKTLEKIALYAYEKGIKVLSIFAFSTDNFKRSQEEVNYLMNLFIKMFNKKFEVFQEKGIKVVFSGQKEKLPLELLEAMSKITKATFNNTKGVINICLNYNGQDEIVDATKKIGHDLLTGKITTADISPCLFQLYLYHDLPAIDFMIRTSGEYRLSNFMLWQLAYAELYFPKVYFPAFSITDFDEAMLEFNRRNRRFGDVKDERKSN